MQFWRSRLARASGCPHRDMVSGRWWPKLIANGLPLRLCVGWQLGEQRNVETFGAAASINRSVLMHGSSQVMRTKVSTVANMWRNLIISLLSTAGILRSTGAAVPCNATHNFCDEILWKGSMCLGGYCTNPFQGGCLKQMLQLHYGDELLHDGRDYLRRRRTGEANHNAEHHAPVSVENHADEVDHLSHQNVRLDAFHRHTRTHPRVCNSEDNGAVGRASR